MRLLDIQLWLVGGSIAAGVGALLLVRYLYRHRDRPGAVWFMATLTAQAVFCLSYGVSLLVFDLQLRAILEMVALLALCTIGPLYLAFALKYTGRTDLFRSRLFWLVVLVPLVTIVIGVTAPFHDLMWVDFRLEPVFGVAAVQYTFGPWATFAFVFTMAIATLSTLLLIEALLSYGPLYRREVTAVAVSTIPPTIGLLLWFFELGPVPQLNLTPILFLPHVVLDAYAFMGTHMFNTNPTTRRAAERSAIEDLNEPVIVIDTEQRIVDLNARAELLFGVDRRAVLATSLDTLTGVTLEELQDNAELTFENSRRVFSASHSTLTDPSGATVGGLVVLYDVSEEQQRKQQLSVLNRIFRHNLRNELNLVQGYADTIADAVEDPQLRYQAESIAQGGARLLSIGEKVREFERSQEQGVHVRPIDVRETLVGIRQELDGRYPDATVSFDVESSAATIRTDSLRLNLILSNLVENGIEHAENPEPVVSVDVYRSAADPGRIRFDVRDTAPEIHEEEIIPLREGTESALQHGSGIGLWIVNWCVTALDGEIAFRYDDGNVVTVTLPDDPDI